MPKTNEPSINELKEFRRQQCDFVTAVVQTYHFPTDKKLEKSLTAILEAPLGKNHEKNKIDFYERACVVCARLIRNSSVISDADKKHHEKKMMETAKLAKKKKTFENVKGNFDPEIQYLLTLASPPVPQVSQVYGRSRAPSRVMDRTIAPGSQYGDEYGASYGQAAEQGSGMPPYSPSDPYAITPQRVDAYQVPAASSALHVPRAPDAGSSDHSDYEELKLSRSESNSLSATGEYNGQPRQGGTDSALPASASESYETVPPAVVPDAPSETSTTRLFRTAFGPPRTESESEEVHRNPEGSSGTNSDLRDVPMEIDEPAEGNKTAPVTPPVDPRARPVQQDPGDRPDRAARMSGEAPDVAPPSKDVEENASSRSSRRSRS